MAGLEAHYSVRDIGSRIPAAVRAARLNPEQRLSPEALGALDHFHTGHARRGGTAGPGGVRRQSRAKSQECPAQP